MKTSTLALAALKTLIGIVTILCMVGCRTTKQTTTTDNSRYATTHDTLYMTTAKVDTQYLNSIRWDSIMIHDSIYEKEYTKGDTVVQFKYVDRIRYRDRLKTDTIYTMRLQTDTVYATKTDTMYTDSNKDTTKVVKDKMYAVRWCLIGAVIGAAVVMIWTIKRQE